MMVKKATSQPEQISDSRREMVFQDLLGHDKIIDLFRHMIDRNRLPHALLLHGPAHIGKTSTAYCLIRRVECLEGGEDPDCTCRACQKLSRVIQDEIDKKTRQRKVQCSWYDLSEIYPKPSGQKMIEIDPIREVDERVAQMPMEGKRRFLIIHGADRMNREAANAFLKTLEEPPPHLQIILITSNYNGLLPTVRSRCTEVRFSPVETKKLAEWLREMRGGDPEANETIAAYSGGCPGLALEMAQADIIERRLQALDALATFQEHGYKALFKTAYEINRATGEDMPENLDILLAWYRDLIVASCVVDVDERLFVNRDLAQRLKQDSANYSATALLNAAQTIVDSYPWSKRLVQPQLAMENLLLDIGSATRRR